jgi:putative membrane protein
MFTTAADAPRAEFARNRLLQGLAAGYAVWWGMLAIAPYNRFDWLLENLLVFVFAGLLAATYRRFPLSDLSYLLITVFLVLHAVGAHYTYSEAPVGGWMTELLGWERNHYDRVVHFLFGLLCTYPLRETVMRSCKIGGWRAGALAFAVVLALSSGYEMLEWGAAMLLSPEAGMAFLGAQGDIFDAQKDTVLAAAGALVTLAVTPLAERTPSRPFAGGSS